MRWPPELPLGCRFALDTAARIVPRRYRETWRREWMGELAYVVERIRRRRERERRRAFRRMTGAAGRDALWLRVHREPLEPWEWRREHRRRSDVLFRMESTRGKGDSIVSRLASDFWLALRRLGRTPRYAVLVMGVLALGIGATTTVATLVEAVLLRPLPYTEAARVVRVLAYDPGKGQLDWVSWAEVQLWREAESFDQVAASTIFPATWKREEGSIRIQRAFVSPGYFELLGVSPRLGKSLTLDDGTVVISHRLWRQKWGSSPDVLGQGMNLDGRLYEVIAVAPETLYDHDLGGVAADAWIGESLDETVADSNFRIFTFFGRLEPGSDPSAAELELSRRNASLASTEPRLYDGWEVRAEGLQESMVGHFRPALGLLFGVVLLVLLVVATNLSNLVLTRTLARRRELAVHIALGARSGEIIRSVAVENSILAIAGGVLGIGLSRIALRLFSTLVSWPLPRQAELLLEPPRVLMPLALAVAIALVFGTVPALLAMRRDLAASLSSSSRSSTGRSRWRGILIAAQVALSVPLVMSAALLVRSVLNLERSSSGLAPNRLLSLRVSLPREWIGTPEPANLARVARFFQETMEDVRALPEVVEVGASIFPPFLGEADRARFQIAGDPVPDPAEAPRALLHVVTPGYFETLGSRMVTGRAFDTRDTDRSAPVAIVSAELARRSFPGLDPLGRIVTTEWTFGPDAPAPRTIVGVVEDIAQLGPIEPIEPQIYFPHAQAPYPSLALLVRTAGSPEALVRGIEKQVIEREPLAILEEPITLGEALSAKLSRPRFYAQFLGLFAATAAALFALGLYGLLSYRVATQHRELGLRAALGASPATLLASVVESGLWVSGVGFLAGAAIALTFAQVLRSFVHGVSVYDPLTLTATPILILVTTLAASFFPARRAARVEIVEALRLDE